MPNYTPKPSDLNSNPISVVWPSKGKTTFKGPIGLRERVVALLKAIDNKVGIQLSMSAYILSAIRYYGYYLQESKDLDELKTRLSEKHEILDVEPNEASVEEHEKGQE